MRAVSRNIQLSCLLILICSVTSDSGHSINSPQTALNLLNHPICAAPKYTEKVATQAKVATDVPDHIGSQGAKFLSFEEWKARNLAEKQQQAESISTLATNAESQTSSETSITHASADDMYSAETAPASPTETTRDTYETFTMPAAEQTVEAQKERFNHASFDCAASIIQANKESKGSSNILKANKDQYMLNTCAASSKFVIVELCNDILVDTIQLANYEYFSGVFKSFRAQVAAKYPPGREGWQDLGTFKARHVRDTQSFLVENPLIWAKYLKIEMLSFYGNEFYCPLSLVRVFGKTMMEDYKQEGLQESGEMTESGMELASSPMSVANMGAYETLAGHLAVVTEHLPSIPLPFHTQLEPVQASVELITSQSTTSVRSAVLSFAQSATPESSAISTCPTTIPHLVRGIKTYTEDFTSSTFGASDTSSHLVASDNEPSLGPSSSTSKTPGLTSVENSNTATETPHVYGVASEYNIVHSAVNSTVSSTTMPQANGTKISKNPPVPTPSTQESFYKQIVKRLTLLEANATLSLQYIEAQSILLAQSFSHLSSSQSRHLASFLDNVNSTLLHRSTQVKQEYEQLYDDAMGTVELSRRRHDADMKSFSSRLDTLSDDIIFFKRLALFQSLLLILLIAIVVTSQQNGIDIQDHFRNVLQRSEEPENMSGWYPRGMSPLSWRDRVRSVSLAASPYGSSPYMFPVRQIDRPRPGYAATPPDTLEYATDDSVREGQRWTHQSGLGLALQEAEMNSVRNAAASEQRFAQEDSLPSVALPGQSEVVFRGTKDDMDTDLSTDIRRRLYGIDNWHAHEQQQDSMTTHTTSLKDTALQSGPSANTQSHITQEGVLAALSNRTEDTAVNDYPTPAPTTVDFLSSDED